ncbi:MAG: hypothetical protein IPP31_01600 [Chitinophagaceae bacterium]|nr:hypothetical protein [Chitinophagaceae bacterium]
MHYLFVLLFATMVSDNSQSKKNNNPVVSPLSDFSEEWNDPRFQVCNTAADAEYLNEEEKNVIYILNLARYDPKLFCNTVVKQYPEYNDNAELVHTTYYQSLLATMRLMKPLRLLQPDMDCFTSAECHAYHMGLTGEEGHDRSDSCRGNLYYNAECCDYGHADPLDIVMSLLIDYAVPSLGHRKICFGNYQRVGVSILPHKRWDVNAVLDFHY